MQKIQTTMPTVPIDNIFIQHARIGIYAHGVICMVENHNPIAVFAVRDMTPVSAGFGGGQMRRGCNIRLFIVVIVFRPPTSISLRVSLKKKNPISDENTTRVTCAETMKLNSFLYHV